METILIANWKMYKTGSEVRNYLAALELTPGVDVRIAPPFTLIQNMVAFRPREILRIGGQDMSAEGHGSPCTGDISAVMLKDIGADFVIIGHSERRTLHGENDKLIAEKMERAIIDGIQPVLCIGESLEQFEAGETESVLQRQLLTALDSLSAAQVQHIIISYEPVWAIGTGKSAKPTMVNSLHHFLKKEIANSFSKEVASSVAILYGGSVNETNIGSFLEQPDINGALIGTAALDPLKFNQMIRSARKLI